MTPLTSTDPSDIANAARCFESCGTDQGALKTYLLTQLGDIATPPCITPTAPVNSAGAKVITNTKLRALWNQLSNSGSLITGYIVYWGTTSGVYTNNSGVLPPTPKVYDISGLTPGTQYFWVVQAVTGIAGCVSANSNEGTGTTTGAAPICAPGVTFANAWAARVIANGGAAPSQATKDAIANFQCGLITDGLDTQMISWNAFVPDSLIATITPQLKGGSNDPWTNHNFVLADLTVNGLKGDAATKFLDTGLLPQGIWGANNPGTDCGITIYNVTNSGSAGMANVGCDDGSAVQQALLNHGGANTCNFESFDTVAGQGKISANDGAFTGYTSGNRTSATASAIYEANSGTAHHTLVSGVTGGGSATPASSLTVFCFQNNTGQSLFTDERMSFVAIHHGLTSAQSALFYARIQQLRTDLGGGFV